MTTNVTEIEVRYQETDQMGIVYHANYLVWFEIGRTKLLEQLGFKYDEMEAHGFLLPVIHVDVTYKTAVTYGQTVRVETKLKQYNGLRIMYEYRIINEKGETAAVATTEHTVVKKGSFKLVRLSRINTQLHKVLQNEMKERSSWHSE